MSLPAMSRRRPTISYLGVLSSFHSKITQDLSRTLTFNDKTTGSNILVPTIDQLTSTIFSSFQLLLFSFRIHIFITFIKLGTVIFKSVNIWYEYELHSLILYLFYLESTINNLLHM